jgi:thiosulfate reductase cytochrome b subunit
MGAKPDCFNRVFIGGRSLVRAIHFAIMSAKITWAAANACMALACRR